MQIRNSRTAKSSLLAGIGFSAALPRRRPLPGGLAEKEPLGHVYLALSDPPELQDVSVRSAYRRRGIATALTQAAEEEAATLGSAACA